MIVIFTLAAGGGETLTQIYLLIVKTVAVVFFPVRLSPCWCWFLSPPSSPPSSPPPTPLPRLRKTSPYFFRDVRCEEVQAILEGGRVVLL